MRAEIDGSTLFDLTLEDMQSDFGKGLKTKKVWKEVQKLVSAARNFFIFADLTESFILTKKVRYNS